MARELATHEPHSLSDALANRHYRGGRFGWLVLLAVAALNSFRGSVTPSATRNTATAVQPSHD